MCFTCNAEHFQACILCIQYIYVDENILYFLFVLLSVQIDILHFNSEHCKRGNCFSMWTVLLTTVASIH